MAGEPFLLTRLDSDIPHRSDISSRLREHLIRLRGHEIDDTVEIWDDTTGAVSEYDLTRIHRRATAYVDRLRAASGTAHLKPHEKERLSPVKDGVRAMTVKTEARADEIAAGLHAQMTAAALDAIIETLQHHRDRADALSLRAVQRMLDRAEQLERRPVFN